jgi:hypothetical protein
MCLATWAYVKCLAQQQQLLSVLITCQLAYRHGHTVAAYVEKASWISL